MLKRRFIFFITTLILLISLAPLGLGGEFDNLNNDIKINDHVVNEYVYDFEDGVVPNDDIIEFSPGYAAWQFSSPPYSSYSGEWVLYSHEVDNFIRFSEPISYFSAYYSVGGYDYIVTAYDVDGEVLNEMNVSEGSQTSFVEFNSTGNNIYEIRILGNVYTAWIIDYITVQKVSDVSNFIFELDYYCCDVLGIDQPFNFGGVLEDENGNAFQGEIDVLYGINGPVWEGYYEMEYNISSPNYLNVSLISNSNNLGYYELNITIVLVDVMTLPSLYFEFERIQQNEVEWFFEITNETQTIYESEPYILEGYIVDSSGEPMDYVDDNNNLFEIGIYYHGWDPATALDVTDQHIIDFNYDFVSGFVSIQIYHNGDDYDNYYGWHDVDLRLVNDPTQLLYMGYFDRYEWPIEITVDTTAVVLYNDEALYISGIATERAGNPFYEVDIMNFFVFDLDDTNNSDITHEYILGYEYDYTTGEYLVILDYAPEYITENKPKEGNFGLSFTFDILLANGEVFGNPFYFEFERIVDYTEPTDTSSNITDSNSTTTITSDLNNSTTIEISNVTESSLPPEGPQVSIPVGLPGFELLFAIISTLTLPIARQIFNKKIKLS